MVGGVREEEVEEAEQQEPGMVEDAVLLAVWRERRGV